MNISELSNEEAQPLETSSPVRSMDSSVERILANVLDSNDDVGKSSSDSSDILSLFGDDSIEDPHFVPDEAGMYSSEPDMDGTARDNQNQNTLLQPRNVIEQDTPSRKRKLHKEKWKTMVLSRKRQSGKEYVNSSGKTIPAKSVQPAKCDKSCHNTCISLFPESSRSIIHSAFWVLNDTEKKIFYAKYVTKVQPKRKRTKLETSRKQNTFHYFFQLGDQKLRVCRSFFLATLAVSQRSIYYYFQNNFNTATGIPKPNTKGKHVKKKVSDDLLNKVRKHIESFHCMDSHYLRAGTQRQYLEAGLSIRKMYRLYKTITGLNEPKYHIYKQIFNNEYNLSFFVPKKDICDSCCKYESLSNPTASQTENHTRHKELNESAKERKKADKELMKRDDSLALVSYDLENVFTLPKGNASNFYYKRKLNLYNLTGYCHNNGITYCAIWYESQSGRTGNDIASALISILKAVLKDNAIVKKIILWSDSCVPQNRNRITSLALLKLSQEHNLISITQRFSVPGHSRVQEVDAVHSVIERHLKHIDYHSPVSLIRHLAAMSYDNVKLKLIQMKPTNFLNYNKASLGFNFASVKFTMATELLYENDNNFVIKYKTNYKETEDYVSIPVLVQRNQRGKDPILYHTLPEVTKTLPGVISKEKVKDITSMFPFMPNNEDIEFYKAILKLPM